MLEFLSNLYNFIFPEHNGIIYAIDPLTIGLIAGGAQALFGGIQAATAGRRQAEPKYEIPKEVFDVTKQAQEMAQTGMPEASRMMALQGAQQSALFGMRAAQDRRGGLAALGNIQAGLDRTNLSVAAQDAAMRQQNMVRAQQALMTQAGFRDKAFANQWQSWMNREQQRRANVGAGMQNIARGITSAGSTALLGMQLDALGETNNTVAEQRNTAIANIGTALTNTPTGRALLGVPQGMAVSGRESMMEYGTRALPMLARFF